MDIQTPPALPVIAPPAFIEVTPLLRIHKMALEIEVNKYVSGYVAKMRAIDDSRMVYFLPSPKKAKPRFRQWLQKMLIPTDKPIPSIAERDVRAAGSYRGARRNAARVEYRKIKKEERAAAREATAAIAAVTA